jgi:hypothetical protein
MKDECKDVREQLASGEDASYHLETCAECREIARALGDVDSGLALLRDDAFAVSDDLVERTAKRIETIEDEPERVGVGAVLAATARAIAGGLYSAAALAWSAIVALPSLVLGSGEPKEQRRTAKIVVPLVAVASAGGALVLFAVGSVSMVQRDPDLGTVAQSDAVDRAQITVDGTRSSANQRVTTGDVDLSPGQLRLTLEERGYRDRSLVFERTGDDIDGRFGYLEDHEEDGDGWWQNENGDLARDVGGESTVREPETNQPPEETEHEALEQAAPVEGEQAAFLPERFAQSFLGERERTEGLSFVEPRGYWANTYLPGDPEVRLLERRLGEAGETTLGSTGLSPLALAELADRGRQPFDAPAETALALYVHADRRAGDARSRMIVQVGLKASSRRAGRRPAMHVAVVLDARTALDAESQSRVRALLDALSRARDTGDRMSLFAAGPHGGVLVPSGQLRRGEVEVALTRLFGGENVEHAPADVGSAVRAAVESIAADDQAVATLGAGLVLVVTPGLSDADGDALSDLAHVAALGGVTTSVVGLGTGAALDPLDAVALAGQGRGSVLDSTSAATAAVTREIEAVSRIVARSIRLRIRLAAGVQLVGVLGSYRLDDDQAERVREAESAIDRELALRLGITSDRGEDEDGMQIVVPAFYADDSHVILLDVVAPPGPIADVRARYKDLLHLRNESATGAFELARGTNTRGPLELNVLENLVAFEIGTALDDASRMVAAGDRAAAERRIDEARAMVAGLEERIPELGRSGRLDDGVALAGRYVAALSGDAQAGQDAALCDSMRYAAFRLR